MRRIIPTELFPRQKYATFKNCLCTCALHLFQSKCIRAAIPEKTEQTRHQICWSHLNACPSESNIPGTSAIIIASMRKAHQVQWTMAAARENCGRSLHKGGAPEDLRGSSLEKCISLVWRGPCSGVRSTKYATHWLAEYQRGVSKIKMA